MDKEQAKTIAMFGYSITEIPGLKRTPTMTFYTKDGRAIPNLPADPRNLQHYLAKGFTLEPPKILIKEN